MPRPPRLHVPGGCYHVLLRGNHREALFVGAQDRAVLNEIVGDVLVRFGCRIHAFCWMTNHLHALVQIADRPLGNVMQRIAMRYARYRHRALNTSGHLFERRHKAKLIDGDTYFLALLRYIHLNPVKARMVGDPLHYPWSSHRAYLGLEVVPWLTTQFGLGMFASNIAQARIAYERFILEPISGNEDLDPQSRADDPRVLGGEQFMSTLPVAACKPPDLMTLEQLAIQVANEHGISPNVLRSPSRARHLAEIRVKFAHQAIERCHATMSEIATFLNRDTSSLSKLLARHESRAQA